MSVLITGGAGFVGSNLARSLIDQGERVIVLDNLSASSNVSLPSDVELVKGDICDTELVFKLMKTVDRVVHLAAKGSVVDSVEDPVSNFSVNVKGTFSVLECASRADLKRLVFASTGGALIGAASPPVNESSLPKPISPYGASKLCGEAYCHAFAKSHGVPTLSLRFANVYGPFSDHKKGAVTKFIKSMLYGGDIVIYGDGTSTRDYIYVDDLCNGIILGLYNDAVEAGEVLHLAYGLEVSIRMLADQICSAFGVGDYDYKYESSRVGEVERNFASYEKAKQILGFTPKVDLAFGIERTVEWFKEYAGVN